MEKPCSNQHRHPILLQQLQLQSLHNRNSVLNQHLEDTKPELIWQSVAMSQLIKQLVLIAVSDANIILPPEKMAQIPQQSGRFYFDLLDFVRTPGGQLNLV